jgi:hypothetical protein
LSARPQASSFRSLGAVAVPRPVVARRPHDTRRVRRDFHLQRSFKARSPISRTSHSPGSPDCSHRLGSRAVEAGVPAGWVTADQAYGQDSKSRSFLRRTRPRLRGRRIPRPKGRCRQGHLPC